MNLNAAALDSQFHSNRQIQILTLSEATATAHDSSPKKGNKEARPRVHRFNATSGESYIES
jgi:hypothetical protein